MDIQEQFIDLPSGHKCFCRFREGRHSEWLVVTHGIGEHCGRYDFIFEELSYRYNILTYDLRGHGRSAGRKWYIDSFSQFRYDLNEILSFFSEHYGLSKFSLFGHSMGALIVCDYMQSHKTQKNNILNKDFYPDQIFISSLPISPGGILGKIVSLVPGIVIHKLSTLDVGIGLQGLVDVEDLSHDIYAQEAYKKDPLVSTKLHTKLLLGLLDTARRVGKSPLSVHCPLTCAVGSEDKVVDPNLLVQYSKVIEPKMNVRVFPGGRHELHNEIRRIRDDYLSFLKNTL